MNIKNLSVLALLCTLSLFLAGCFGANSSTTGNTTSRKYDVGVQVTNTGEGTYNNYFYLGATASTDTQSEQSAEGNVASDSTELKASLTGDGGTASFAERGAEMFMEGVSSEWAKWQDYRKKDSDNPIDNGTGTPIAVKPIIISNDPASKVKPSIQETMLIPYDTTMYEDGRARYLFRGTMEKLVNPITIKLNGKTLYTLNRIGDRWQGPNDVKGPNEPLLKNSDGRVNSITLLLPKTLAKGDATLVHGNSSLN